MRQSTVKLKDLKLDPKNAREHPEKNLAAIQASLEEFGQVLPLVVDGDTMTVVGGNGTTMCMRKLGWDKASAIVIKGWTREKLTALALALNRTGDLARWNKDVLADLVSEFSDDTDMVDLLSSLQITDILPALPPMDLPDLPDTDEDDDDDERAPGGRVKLIQLYYSMDDYESFFKCAAKAKQGEETNSDTVLRLMREAADG